MAAEIAKLQAEMEQRHERELAEVRSFFLYSFGCPFGQPPCVVFRRFAASFPCAVRLPRLPFNGIRGRGGFESVSFSPYSATLHAECRGWRQLFPCCADS